MKRVVAMAAVIALAFGLVACGGSTESATTEQTSAIQAGSNSEAPASAEGKIGKYALKIKSTEVFTTSDGEEALKVVLDFTNVSNDTATSFLLGVSEKAYQDGVEIERVFDTAKLGSNTDKELKKGATLEVQIAFKLSNTESPVELEFGEAFSFSNDKVTQTVNIK